MRIVRTGRWLYADSVDKPVDIVGLRYDFWYELAKEDGQLEPDETPQVPGEYGLLYYVRFRHAGETSTPTWPDSGAHATIDAAMCAAEETAPSVITWERAPSAVRGFQMRQRRFRFGRRLR